MRDTISILDGSTFLVCDRGGDVDASPAEAQGFFFRDTRFLSRWLLTTDGERANVLSTDETQYFAARFFLVPPRRNTVSIIRNRTIGDGFHEDVTILNHAPDPLELTLRLDAGSDFADLFEVKDALDKKGDAYHRIEEDTLVLGYRRDDFVRETRIRASQDAAIDENGFTFCVNVEPHAEWNTCVFVQPVTESGAPAIKHRHGDEERGRTLGSASTSSSRVHRGSIPTGTRLPTCTSEASSTSPRCGSSPSSSPARRCRRRACRGS